MYEAKHCDDYINDQKQPLCLRYFLLVHRLPAIDKLVIIEKHGNPKLFANCKGKSERVRVTMASRFGDVGISYDTTSDLGYDTRVPVEYLSNFSEVE